MTFARAAKRRLPNPFMLMVLQRVITSAQACRAGTEMPKRESAMIPEKKMFSVAAMASGRVLKPARISGSTGPRAA